VILDSSAIIAIVLREEGHLELLERIGGATAVGVGAPTMAEASVVIRVRLDVDPLPILDRMVRDFDLAIVEFEEQHWREASDAFARFGKGRHPAALNFGDCMSYAITRVAGDSLLFVGDDFRKTDIDPAA
jgi:ribonuclease VapC